MPGLIVHLLSSLPEPWSYTLNLKGPGAKIMKAKFLDRKGVGECSSLGYLEPLGQPLTLAAKYAKEATALKEAMSPKSQLQIVRIQGL